MKIKVLSGPVKVQSAPEQKHNYFGWPSIVRLKNGDVAVAGSGYRLEHICPFGKAVMSVSHDDCLTFSEPETVIDTVLDDRDSGLCPFDESGLIVTSFNNTVAFQRSCCNEGEIKEYLDSVNSDEEKAALGSEFRVSFDNGQTFGPVYHSPVTSPHGPIQVRDGRILWLGRVFMKEEFGIEGEEIRCCSLNPQTGECTFVGAVPDIAVEGIMGCEPYMAELADGTLIAHIRAERKGYFTLYSTESKDGGVTWSQPVRILPKRGGSPAHLLLHSSGVLISAYGYREKPYGIRLMLIPEGKGRAQEFVLWDKGCDADLGYPATVEKKDGTLFTVFYAHTTDDGHAEILGIHWKITDD